MKSCLAVLLVTNFVIAQQDDKPKLSVNDRINFLKFQLGEQLREQQMKHAAITAPVQLKKKLLYENYDYVDLSNVPITPIMDNDERKKERRYKLRQLRTTSTTTTTITTPTTRKRSKDKKTTRLTTTTLAPLPPLFNPLRDDIPTTDTTNSSLKRKRHKKGKRKGLTTPEGPTTLKPLDTFYRYRRLDESAVSKPVKWVHCADLVAPFFSGMVKTLNAPVLLGTNHRTVARLVQLLSFNTSTYTKSEIYSVMYQISNLQIRLFQWDVAALNMLFNSIIPGHKRHTFKLIKYALKNLFKKWHMDFSNTTNLLAQSRIFRPLCINNIAFDGSTKSSKVSKFYPSTSPTTPCSDNEDEEDE